MADPRKLLFAGGILHNTRPSSGKRCFALFRKRCGIPAASLRKVHA
jgi:hypothetical protein